jgi:hypothetical protein
MILLGIVIVGLDVTDQLLIRFSAFGRYWRNNGSTMTQYIRYSDFKIAYDSVRREVLYNILNEFGIPMKVGIGKHLSDNFHIRDSLKQRAALEYAIRKVKKTRWYRN